MGKGDETRSAIVGRALALASQVGIEGLSIGGLAGELGLSKSGLFAHFKSKQDLQLRILEEAVERFTRNVVRPALREPRGVPRIRALFDRWLAWSKDARLPGGCVFMSLASELDDRPGPLLDRLRQHQEAWVGGLARAARIAIDEGHFRRDLDVEQFAYELFSVFLGCNHFNRLMRDPAADERARRAVDRLIEQAGA